MADFPTTIYSPRVKANYAGVVYAPSLQDVGFAEDVQKLDAEVVALEIYLDEIANGNGTITRVAGLVTSIVVGGRTITITRDVNNNITSWQDSVHKWTITRVAGQITAWVVTLL